MFKSDDLLQLRGELNEIDDKLFTLFIKRYKLCKQIGEINKSLKIPIYQPQIYNEKLNKIIEKAQIENIPQEVIEKLYNIIHEICVDAQSID